MSSPLATRDNWIPAGVPSNQQRGKRMKKVKLGVWTAALAFGTVYLTSLAHADELFVLSPAALRGSMQTIIPKFESSSGHKVRIDFGPAGGLARRFEEGEKADIIILTEAQIDDLQKRGRIVEGSKLNLSQVGIGIFMKPGSALQDLTTVESFKNTLLAARSLGHNDPASGAPSGIYVANMLAKLDVWPQIQSKIQVLPANSAAIYKAVAEETLEIGFGQITEILEQPSVALMGPLPHELQNYTIFTAGLAADSTKMAAARTLINYLTLPAALAVMKEKGLQAP